MDIFAQKYFTTQEVADLLKVTPITLCNWRKRGKGPVYAKIGKRILYSQKAITKFFNKHIIREATR